MTERTHSSRLKRALDATGTVAAIALLACGGGCVRRTLTITTDPPHARVYVNDREIGVSKVSTDFTWYGDYNVVVRKQGYKTLRTNWKIDPPWYEWIPIDFFFEVLWPGQLHDMRSNHFVLAPAVTPDPDDLVKRAEETRKRALDPRK